MNNLKYQDVQLVHEPTIIPIAEMRLDWDALNEVGDWLKQYRPECLPFHYEHAVQLFPHGSYVSAEDALDGIERTSWGPGTDNELLVEFAGRKCYDSFGAKAGRKTNAAYLARLHGTPDQIPHASVFYHAKISFFFAGISRKLTHQLMRNYVGADRSEEGCPSQESTRYTEHPGWFVVPPRDLNNGTTERFQDAMRTAYREYQDYLAAEVATYTALFDKEPTGMDRKRIYEAAAARLPWSMATSLVWTTNPVALSKLIRERTDEAADLEIRRFAEKLKRVCHERWPNLFPESNPDVTTTRTSQAARLASLEAWCEKLREAQSDETWDRVDALISRGPQ